MTIIRWGVALGLLALGCGDDGTTDPDAARDLGIDTGSDLGGVDLGGEDFGIDLGVDLGVDAFDAGPPDCSAIVAEIANDAYLVSATTGDCGDADEFAPQMISATIGGGVCDITFSSTDGKAGLLANGMVAIGADGSFTAQTVTLGSVDYTCDGSWDGSTYTLTCSSPTSCTIGLVVE